MSVVRDTFGDKQRVTYAANLILSIGRPSRSARMIESIVRIKWYGDLNIPMPIAGDACISVVEISRYRNARPNMYY